jgi:hypothetical protein
MKPLQHEQAPLAVHDLLDELIIAPNPKGTKAMLLYEDLARERRREAERDAQHQRLVRQLSAIKRWERISEWASRRARIASERV